MKFILNKRNVAAYSCLARLMLIWSTIFTSIFLWSLLLVCWGCTRTTSNLIFLPSRRYFQKTRLVSFLGFLDLNLHQLDLKVIKSWKGKSCTYIYFRQSLFDAFLLQPFPLECSRRFLVNHYLHFWTDVLWLDEENCDFVDIVYLCVDSWYFWGPFLLIIFTSN